MILILVTQFNSVFQPVIIMTSVILSLGGVFLGLTIMELPFGIIMTGVGVISLAGVVVNNGIVLIDYTNRLHQRGMHFREAIIAAGCTRLRPVLLTAITTILGLLPMVTGIAFDFHKMEISWVSESSQWWSSMASAVIFGLALATVLTLVVVPALYSLVHTTSRSVEHGVKRIRQAYWAPFYRLTGTTPEEE
jgi:multidrug efflux pump subunit AcrB